MNDYGQLGNGTSSPGTDKTTPVRVANPWARAGAKIPPPLTAVPEVGGTKPGGRQTYGIGSTRVRLQHPEEMRRELAIERPTKVARDDGEAGPYVVASRSSPPSSLNDL
jgi:hypothetical protein